MKRVLALLHTTLPAEAHLVLTVHDEVVVECPGALVEIVAHCMRECLVRACRDSSPEVVKAPYWKKD
jgi:hypothetical protein